MKHLTSIIVLLALPAVFARAEPDIEVVKSVSNAVPAAGEPVEFTVEVRNIGDQAAPGVVIIDKLPTEMAIPDGMAAFVSVGSYDPVTGEWGIGSLDAGGSATLVVPATVTGATPPPCVVNVARSDFIDVYDDNNDESRAAVYVDSVTRCVDISATATVFAGDTLFPECDSRRSYSGVIALRNAGPDTARDVVVTIGQGAVIGATLRFDDARCATPGSGSCSIATLGSGETALLSVTSDTFQNYEGASFVLSMDVATTDYDYAPDNDTSAEDVFVSGFSSCEPLSFGDIGLGDFSNIGPGCFIATAAYGSSLDPHLDALRAFRDRHLLTNLPGRKFVAMYYRYSPPIADYIAERNWLRAIVRAILTPMVHAIERPLSAGFVIAGIAVVLVARRRRRRNTGGAATRTRHWWSTGRPKNG